MPTPTRKATFSLHEDVLEELDRAVASGAAGSKNAFVAQAIAKQLREWYRKQRRDLWQAAARDPLLLKDIAEADADFQELDAETARRIG